MKCVICDKEYAVGEKPFPMIGSGKHVCRTCLKNVKNMADFIVNESSVRDRPYVDAFSDRRPEYGSENVVSMVNGRFTPHCIKEALDQYVVGQEEAKIALSIASYNHMKRTALKDPCIQKSNILMIGPTGCGKTHLVRTLGKILHVPVSITPATSLTEAGYIGNDAESVVANLFFAAGQDIEKAEHGIIFIDEIDKLVSGRAGARKEVGGTGVQQALLPIIEGAKIEIALNGRSGMSASIARTVYIDTTNILFICGGAFPALEDIVHERTTNCGRVGFVFPSDNAGSGTVRESMKRHATTEDLQKFGLIPEFIGRVPVHTTLDPLDVNTLRKILTEPKDSIVSQYRKLFAYDGIDLIFEDHALDVVAERAWEQGTGARALRGVMEDALKRVMYDAPSDDMIEKICITGSYVEGETDTPDICYRNKPVVQFGRI